MLMIEIKPSRAYRIGMIGIAVGALIAIVLTQLSVWLKAGLMAALFVYAYHQWKNNQDNVVAVKCDDERRWTLITREGNEIHVALEGSSVRSGFLLQLNFRAQNGKHINMTLFKDSVSEDGFRQLSKVLLLLP